MTVVRARVPVSVFATLCVLLAASVVACRRQSLPPQASIPSIAANDAGAPRKAARPVVAWDPSGPLGAGETYAVDGAGHRRLPVAEAHGLGFVDVDLSDDWAPFIFSESDDDKPAKPNPYRRTFIALANDRASPEELFLETPQGELTVLSAAGIPLGKGAADTPDGKRAIAEARRVLRVERDRNYLEAYGIPPTLSVLLARLDEDDGRDCYDKMDLAGLAGFDGTVTFQGREQAKREYAEALSDAGWVDKLTAGDKAAADATTGKVQLALSSGASEASEVSDDGRDVLLDGIARDDRKHALRIERYRRGQARLRAVRAVQARLVCEGILEPRTKILSGAFDLATHEALAAWERKNDIFGWGFLGGETLAALQRPQSELHFETFRRILMERIADSAGILEDGSASAGKGGALYRDASGEERTVPNLIGAYVEALLSALGIRNADDVAAFLRSVGREGMASLHLAFRAPSLPPYYGPYMELSVEIDRGDVWYDFPFDEKGKALNQVRVNYPTLTVFTHWQKQRIPLVRWRTTIGSWRSEMHPSGKLYYRYKNSDVGPRIWKHIVAAPVWIPPDGTPAKDLLTRKTLNRDVGPVTVVNTDVMGPGFQSAYGLVLAIHHQKSGAGLFDNQIRTHGSVDYTSIARRFSHGCHRLVNSRAVRMFDFILRRTPFERVGNQTVNLRKRFTFEEKQYEYLLDTRGYTYELNQPISVIVTEGRIMGAVKHPMPSFVPKPGVDYGDVDEDSGL